MKIFAVNGSVRVNGNTAYLLNCILNFFSEKNEETKLIQLGKENISGCLACGKCRENGICSISQDVVNNVFEEMKVADAIIIGSPVYYADITSNTKSLIERVGNLTRANNNILARKVGASVISVRRGGAIHSFNSINHLYLISQMIIAGSSYWNIGVGNSENDTEGINTMQTLAKNIYWLVDKITN